MPRGPPIRARARALPPCRLRIRITRRPLGPMRRETWMIDWNRRGLVLAAGGALAAGALKSGSAWASPAQEAPGRKLGYAIVGLGSYGLGMIVPQFANCRHSRLVALVSGDPAKARRVAAEH